MKIKLLAVLTGACFTAPVLAQSNVTFYGIADAGIHVSNTGNGTQYNLASGMADGSRLGFKGTEDLGGGYKAIFNLEARIELDTGANSNGYINNNAGLGLTAGVPGGQQGATAVALRTAVLQPVKIVNANNALFDRTSMVGVVTPAGAFLLGRQYSAAYEIFAGADTFETGTAGGWANIAGGTGGLLTPGVALRANQVLQYRLQLPNGIGAALMAGFNNTGSLGYSKHFWGGNVKYKANGFDVGLGYNAEQDQNGNPSLRSLIFGGSYDVGVTKFFAGYLRMKNDHSALTPALLATPFAAVAAIVGDNARLDADSYTLGMHYRIGKGRVMASIGRTNNKRVADSDATLYALGYDYNLSKRTDLYVVTSHINNQSGAQYAPGGGGFGGGFSSQPGQDANTLQVGMRHRF